jgi:hypothetical protein
VTKNKNVSVLPLEGHVGPLEGRSGPIEAHIRTSGWSKKPGKCQYCQKVISRQYRIQSHEDKCRLKDDHVRKLEMKLNKSVVLDCESKTCRFCNNSYSNLKNLHRHDKVCKYKNAYYDQLLKEIPSTKTVSKGNITINITNNDTTNNTTNTLNNTTNTLNNTMNILNYDHDYAHIPLEQIIKCLQISKDKHEDCVSSLGRFIRDTGKDDKSIIVTNLRGKSVKAYEDGKYVTKEAVKALSHRGQEAAYRLDSAKDEVDEQHQPLWRNKDFGDLESTLVYAAQNTTDKIAKKVLDEVRRAIYDSQPEI